MKLLGLFSSGGEAKEQDTLGGIISYPEQPLGSKVLITLPDLNGLVWKNPDQLLGAVMASAKERKNAGCIVLSDTSFEKLDKKEWDVLNQKEARGNIISMHDDGWAFYREESKGATNIITMIYIPQSLDDRVFLWCGKDKDTINYNFKNIRVNGVEKHFHQVQYHQGVVIVARNDRGLHDGYGSAGQLWRRGYNRTGKGFTLDPARIGTEG